MPLLPGIETYTDQHQHGSARDRVDRAGDILVLRGFFFKDTDTTEIYTLSLHDALPILAFLPCIAHRLPSSNVTTLAAIRSSSSRDRKSTRLNSSHSSISYAVFCLK